MMLMSQSHHQKWHKCLVIGIAIILFSAIIPFSDIFSEDIEDIIYFRGILIGILLISLGSAAILRGCLQNLAIALGGGIASLLFMSTLNLIFDKLIATQNYFYWTFVVTFSSFLIIITLRLWSNKLLHLFKSFRH